MRTLSVLFAFATIITAAVIRAESELRMFEIGNVYKYSYETSAILNEPQVSLKSSLKDVGFKVELNVDVSPVWNHPKETGNQLLQVWVSSPNLAVKARQGPAPEGFVKKSSRINGYPDHPFFIHWKQGSVLSVYRIQDDALSMVNIKKGIASLFQYNSKNIKKRETDSSGDCSVTYKVVNKDKLIKTKEDCKSVTDAPYHTHTNKVLGANIQSESSTTYEFNASEKIVKSIISLETHILRIESRLETGSEVMSRQNLQLKSFNPITSIKYSGKNVKEAVTAISNKLRKKLSAEKLATEVDPKECISCKTLRDLVSNFKNALSHKNLATQSAAIAFIRILHKVRESDQDTVHRVLSDRKYTQILEQLMDIAAAAQTIDSHKAAMDVLNFKHATKIDLPERYLLAISLSSHPPDVIILDLFKLLKSKIASEKLKETLLLTVSSLAHTYSLSGGTNQKMLQDIGKYIITKIDKCPKEDCKFKYIRALKNLRDKKFLPTLMKLISGKDRKSAVIATRALQTMPNEFIDQNVLQQLERVFFQLDMPHDSTVRSLAANIILQHQPSEDTLAKMFENFSQLKEKELNTLILSQIRDISSTDEKIRKRVQNVLTKAMYGNYHILGQNGLSTAFSRSIAQDKTSNSSFTNILEISGGLIKRSTVDVFVNNKEDQMRLLSFEIFAGGLNMFGGDEESQDNEEEANAGIEITLMNTQLRPFVFFTGQGELMGHVWSGTGSERTTCLQGSVLLNDHMQYVPLQNGLNVEMLLTGVVSYDFAGQVEISLWNRNSHSLVEVAAAIVVQGQARIDNSIVQTMIEFNSGAQSQLNFVSDLDFSDDITMCLQMTQPDFEIVENVRKLERIPGSKYMLRKYKKKVMPSPGKTYVMNRKNTELCNKMFR